MTDLADTPRLPDAYLAYRSSAQDEAAYAQMLARIAPGAAPAPAQAGVEAGPAPPAAAAVKSTAPNEEMIQAEMQRLSSTPFDKSKYANPEEAERQRAIESLAGEAPPAPSLAQRAAAAGKDILRGTTTELPRDIWVGLRNTFISLYDGADDLGKWMDSKALEKSKMLEAANIAGGPDEAAYRERLKAGTAEGAAGRALVDQRIVGDPTTVTGNIIKNVVQFMTGMRLAGGQLRALGIPTDLAGWSGRGITAAQGFLAQFEAFDGAQHRLSDLVQQVPSLRNPVTEFLSSKPDDDEATKRVKNALEGTVIGQAADGVLAGLQMLRGAYAARESAQALVDHAAEQPPPAPSAGLEALGKTSPDEAKAAIAQIDLQKFGLPAREQLDAAAGTPEEVAGMRTPAAEPAVKINFARIDGPDDIKNAMQGLADKFKGDIDTARRGVQTFADTQLGAQSVDAWKALMERRIGQPLNAEELLASRQLWQSSAAKVIELADIATQTQTVENLFAFRRMLTTHAAIQQELLGARAEAARAVSAMRIPSSDEPLRLESMVQSLSADAGLKGGQQTALALAQKVQELARAQDYGALSYLAEKGIYARTRDAVLEVYTNGLLTALGTHVKVAVSNAATVALRIGERKAAEENDALLGRNGVAPGETAAQVAGLVAGLKDAFRFAGKIARSAVTPGEPMPALEGDPLSNAITAARTGQYSLQPMGDAEHMQTMGALSSSAFGMADSGWLGKGVDLLGQIVRLPGRALTAEHDFFRSIGYRMELQALAHRQAIADVNAGRISEDALGSRIQELVENPPPQLHMGAVNGALYQTFTDAPGEFAEMLGRVRSQFPLTRLILPFYRIPSRIFMFTAERSPFALTMRNTFWANIQAGGARQSLALSQLGLGSAIMMATADSVLSGQITGSGPLERGTRAVLENEGWQPYSMRVGDRWVQYNRIEPVGSTMAMAADALEAMKNFHAGVNGDDPDVNNLALALTASVANDVTSKSYLANLANFFEAMADPKGQGKRAISSFVGSVVPAGVAAADRVTDPYKREAYRLIDAIRARTPGFSENLPPQRNLWGEPVPSGSGMGPTFDLLSPLGTRPAANEPIDAELLRQQIDIARTPSRTALHGVTLDLNRIDPKIYSRFQELAGNGYKGPDGLGLKDALNALVTGQHPLSPTYQRLTDGPDGTKADMVRDIVSEYRNGAKEQLLTEYPQLAGMVREGLAAKQFLKTGTQ